MSGFLPDIEDYRKKTQTRIAIINPDKCKPKKCKQECKKFCPVNRVGKLCIEVKPTDKVAVISETLCIGCGVCPKKCPFHAITIVNIPGNLESRTTHRFGPNSFKLHGLPTPRAGEVLGIVGSNGIGKSTALKILAGKLKPNLGRFDQPPEWRDILTWFRGSELQNYFTKLQEGHLKAVLKPQFVDAIRKQVKGTVKDTLERIAERQNLGNRLPNIDEIMTELDLIKIANRDVPQLSGGELQRFAIAAACLRNADVYIFDEPTSYLDIKQRLAMARVIRKLVKSECYVLVVEHDLIYP
jgi:ATP-binding cassette subfamily E protein 1